MLNRASKLVRPFLKAMHREKIPFLFKTILVFAVISSSVILVLEAVNPSANIQSLFDAVWWTFVTMTTVGYGDHYPTTVGGKILGVGLMFSGIVISSFFTATIASRFVDRRIREGRGLENVNCKDHLVICGWNEECLQVLTILEGHQNWPKDREIILVLDAPEEEFFSIQDEFPGMELRFIRGKASQDAVLKRANIQEAKIVIILGSPALDTSAADDAVVLTADAIKSLNSRAQVLAELHHRHNVAHLKRANVDEILIKGEFLGFIMGNAACSPGASDVIRDLLNAKTGVCLSEEEIHESLIGKPFRELFNSFRDENDSIVIGVITRVKPLALDDILGSDQTSIDAFIAMAFEKAGKSTESLIGKGLETRINPPDDYIISQNDFAVVVKTV